MSSYLIASEPAVAGAMSAALAAASAAVDSAAAALDAARLDGARR